MGGRVVFIVTGGAGFEIAVVVDGSVVGPESTEAIDESTGLLVLLKTPVSSFDCSPSGSGVVKGVAGSECVASDVGVVLSVGSVAMVVVITSSASSVVNSGSAVC